jgi:hypothetical protein
MSFGGGGSGSAGITAHKHNSQSGEGGALQGRNSIVTGSSIQFNGGAELPIEALM